MKKVTTAKIVVQNRVDRRGLKQEPLSGVSEDGWFTARDQARSREKKGGFLQTGPVEG